MLENAYTFGGLSRRASPPVAGYRPDLPPVVAAFTGFAMMSLNATMNRFISSAVPMETRR
jgi:hypothetical protein